MESTKQLIDQIPDSARPFVDAALRIYVLNKAGIKPNTKNGEAFRKGAAALFSLQTQYGDSDGVNTFLSQILTPEREAEILAEFEIPTDSTDKMILRAIAFKAAQSTKVVDGTSPLLTRQGIETQRMISNGITQQEKRVSAKTDLKTLSPITNLDALWMNLMKAKREKMAFPKITTTEIPDTDERVIIKEVKERTFNEIEDIMTELANNVDAKRLEIRLAVLRRLLFFTGYKLVKIDPTDKAGFIRTLQQPPESPS